MPVFDKIHYNIMPYCLRLPYCFFPSGFLTYNQHTLHFAATCVPYADSASSWFSLRSCICRAMPNWTKRDSLIGIARHYLLDGPVFGEGEVLLTRPDRSRGSPSLLYHGYSASFSQVQRSGRDADNPPHVAPRLKNGLASCLVSVAVDGGIRCSAMLGGVGG